MTGEPLPPAPEAADPMTPRRAAGPTPAARELGTLDIVPQPSTFQLDSWFRDQGLALLVPPRRWGHRLLARTAPALVALLLFAGTAAIVLQFASLPEWDTLPDAVTTTVLLVGAALGVALPLLALIGGPILVGRLSRRAARAAGVVVMLVYLIAFPVLLSGIGTLLFTDDPDVDVAAGTVSWGAALPDTVGTGLVCLLLTWFGVGAVLLWAVRYIGRQLFDIGSIASRALPIILMLVIFAFISAEPWQLTDVLTFAHLVPVGATLLGIAVLAVVPASVTEVREAHASITPAELPALLAATPVADYSGAHPERASLSRAQRMNLTFVFVTAQIIQSAVFLLLFCGLLVLIGAMTVQPATQKAWITHDPVPLRIAGETLPVTENLVKTAVFVAMIAALSFTVAAVSDAGYRDAFFDPILARIRRAIGVHDVARSVTRQKSLKASSPAPAARAGTGIGTDSSADVDAGQSGASDRSVRSAPPHPRAATASRGGPAAMRHRRARRPRRR